MKSVITILCLTIISCTNQNNNANTIYIPTDTIIEQRQEKENLLSEDKLNSTVEKSIKEDVIAFSKVDTNDNPSIRDTFCITALDSLLMVVETDNDKKNLLSNFLLNTNTSMDNDIAKLTRYPSPDEKVNYLWLGYYYHSQINQNLKGFHQETVHGVWKDSIKITTSYFNYIGKEYYLDSSVFLRYNLTTHDTIQFIINDKNITEGKIKVGNINPLETHEFYFYGDRYGNVNNGKREFLIDFDKQLYKLQVINMVNNENSSLSVAFLHNCNTNNDILLGYMENIRGPYDSPEIFQSPLWAGDLNYDNKLDIIIGHQGYCRWDKILFMSTKEDNQDYKITFIPDIRSSPCGC